jgi:hypothetical protein
VGPIVGGILVFIAAAVTAAVVLVMTVYFFKRYCEVHACINVFLEALFSYRNHWLSKTRKNVDSLDMDLSKKSLTTFVGIVR